MTIAGVVEGEVLASDSLGTDPAAADGSRLLSGWRIWIIRLVLLFAILAVWEAIAGNPKKEFALIDVFWVGKPSAILARLGGWIADGTLWFHMFITLREAVIGFIIGSLLGAAAGFVLARNPILARVLDPFIIVIYSIPKLAARSAVHPLVWNRHGAEDRARLACSVSAGVS